MVVALSYVIAVLLTVLIAVFLYPLAGGFWLLGLFGKISDKMFDCTTRMIRSLWRDIGKMEEAPKIQWVCSCGGKNSGRFCSQCGKEKTVPTPNGQSAKPISAPNAQTAKPASAESGEKEKSDK